MKQNYLKSMLLMLMMCLGMSAWAEVTSGTAYNVNKNSTPTGWTLAGTNSNTSYFQLFSSTNYIQTDNFEMTSLTSIKLKARTYGGPSDAQKLITVTWVPTSGSSVVLGTLSPTSTTLTDYALASANFTNTPSAGTGSIKLTASNGTSAKMPAVSQVTITYSNGTPLAKPTNLSAGTPTATSTNLSWDAVEHATSYKVQYKVSTEANWTNVSPDPTTNSCTVNGLTPNTTYAWQVTALTTENGYANGAAQAGSNFTTAAPASHKAYFYVNGTLTDANGLSVFEGSSIDFPDATKTIYGKKFIGWTKTSEYSNTTTAPSDLCNSAKMGNADVTFYAVYVNAVEGADETVKFDAVGVSTATYKTGTHDDNKGNTWSYYASVNNQSGTLYYGLNTNALNYNIGSPLFTGYVKSISLKAYNGSSKDARKLLICSNNETAQPSSGDIDEISIAASQQFTTTYNADLSSAGEFSQFYIYANAALGVSEVNVTYVPVDYSDYCTTVAAPAPVYTAQSLTLKAVGELAGYEANFATFSSSKDAFIPDYDYEGDAYMSSVYTVNVKGEQLVIAPVDEPNYVYDAEINGEYYSGYYIPANTGVLVVTMYFDEPTPITYYDVKNVEIAEVENNMLQPASKDKAELAGYKFYKLAYGDEAFTPSTLGFYWGAADGAAFASREGSAYLAVPGSTPVKGFSFADIETAIKNVEKKAVSNKTFNLQGQRVNAAQKGIYIVNGKKVVK